MVRGLDIAVTGAVLGERVGFAVGAVGSAVVVVGGRVGLAVGEVGCSSSSEGDEGEMNGLLEDDMEDRFEEGVEGDV